MQLLPLLFFGRLQENLQLLLCVTFQILGTGQTGVVTIGYNSPCISRYSFTNQQSACFLELPRDHKHTYRHRAYCLAADHSLEDTNVDGQKSVHLFILCPSRRVSHHLPAGHPVLIRTAESSQLVRANSSFGTGSQTQRIPPSTLGQSPSAPR